MDPGQWNKKWFSDPTRKKQFGNFVGHGRFWNEVRHFRLETDYFLSKFWSINYEIISVGFYHLTIIWGHLRSSEVFSEGLKEERPFWDHLNLILKSGLFENLNEKIIKGV